MKFNLAVLVLIFLIGITIVQASSVGIDGEIGVDLIPAVPINYSTIQIVNQSDFWDLLDEPADLPFTSSSPFLSWTGIDIDYDAALLNTTIDERTAITYFNATSIEVVDGTDNTNDINAILTYDGVTYNISEGAGAPGMDVRINFTGVSDFNQLVIRMKTTDGGKHRYKIQIWDYDETIWEDYTNFVEVDIFKVMDLGVYDADEHISGEIVQVRIYLEDAGVPAHEVFIDWIVLSLGTATFSTNEVDPLSWHKDENIDAENYNATFNYLNASNLTTNILEFFNVLKNPDDRLNLHITGTGNGFFTIVNTDPSPLKVIQFGGSALNIAGGYDIIGYDVGQERGASMADGNEMIRIEGDTGDITTEGDVRVGDGTEGAPSFSFGSDTDVGMYYIAGVAAVRGLGFSVNGVERMNIKAGGTTVENLEVTGVLKGSKVVFNYGTNLVNNNIDLWLKMINGMITSATVGYVMPRAGSITAVHGGCNIDSSGNPSNISWLVKIDNVDQFSEVQILNGDTGQITFGGTYARDTYTFSAGDQIQVKSDIIGSVQYDYPRCTLEVQFDT